MLPEIQTIQGQDRIISQFLGLNQKDTSNDESFKDMHEMTSDEYPYLAPRNNCATRSIYSGSYFSVLGSVTYGEDIYTVQFYQESGTPHTKFFKNFEEVSGVTLEQNAKTRQLVVYGAYIVIFPDNVMYNTETEEVENMSYEDTFTQTSYIYLSDINGVPYIGDEFTAVQASPESSTYFNGITKNLRTFGPRHQENTGTLPLADSKLKTILNNYTATRQPNFIEQNIIANYENSTTTLPNFNVIINQHTNLKLLSDDTTYKTSEISRSKNGDLSLVNYNAAMAMFSPVDIYLTIWIKTSNAESLSSKIKAGDFIEVDCLKSNGKIIEETDTKKSWYELVKKLNNKIRVEKVLNSSTEVGIIFKADTINYLNILRDATNKINYYKCEVYNDPYTQDVGYAKGIYKFDGLMFLTGSDANSICNKITIKKTLPDMDYITVSQNRIWGCSSENHEIYACKHGDATAWYQYAGLSSDSYAVTIPNGDKFTGAVTYSDMPYFFTENMAYSIMGNKPKNYQVQNYELRGVEDGAYQTIAQKDGYVYYKSKSGIERFNGNNAQSLTEYLDLEGMKGYIGQTNNDKYFVFLGVPGNADLYVYDIKKRLWHKERNDMPLEMVELDNNLYLLDGQLGSLKLRKINGKAKEVADILVDNEPTYDTPKWWVESGEFNGQSLLNKYITKFMFEMKLEQNSKVSIYFMYDDSGEWEEVFRTTDKQVKKLISVPILVRRCERMRYKIKGEGQAKIYSISITSEGGSEIG